MDATLRAEALCGREGPLPARSAIAAAAAQAEGVAAHTQQQPPQMQPESQPPPLLRVLSAFRSLHSPPLSDGSETQPLPVFIPHSVAAQAKLSVGFLLPRAQLAAPALAAPAVGAGVPKRKAAALALPPEKRRRPAEAGARRVAVEQHALAASAAPAARPSVDEKSASAAAGASRSAVAASASGAERMDLSGERDALEIAAQAAARRNHKQPASTTQSPSKPTLTAPASRGKQDAKTQQEIVAVMTDHHSGAAAQQSPSQPESQLQPQPVAEGAQAHLGVEEEPFGAPAAAASAQHFSALPQAAGASDSTARAHTELLVQAQSQLQPKPQPQLQSPPQHAGRCSCCAMSSVLTLSELQARLDASEAERMSLRTRVDEAEGRLAKAAAGDKEHIGPPRSPDSPEAASPISALSVSLSLPHHLNPSRAVSMLAASSAQHLPPPASVSWRRSHADNAAPVQIQQPQDTSKQHGWQQKQQAPPLPKYQLLSYSPQLGETFDSSPSATAAQLQSALSGCEPSILLLLSHGHGMGLHFWQDVAEPERIMFDATQFNQLAGYTPSKGIKGDFLARMKRKLDEEMAPTQSRSHPAQPAGAARSPLLSTLHSRAHAAGGDVSPHAMGGGCQPGLELQTAAAAASPMQLQLREMMDADSLASSTSSSSDEEDADGDDVAGEGAGEDMVQPQRNMRSDSTIDCTEKPRASSFADRSAGKRAQAARRGRPLKRHGKLPQRDRDDWASDSFSVLTASGYSTSELIDARVGSTRVVCVQPSILRRLLPARESTLYLLHVLVLAAWVEAKFHHAGEVIDKLLLRRLLEETDAHAAITASTHSDGGAEPDLHTSQQRLAIDSAGAGPSSIPCFGPAGAFGMTTGDEQLAAARSKLQHDLQIKNPATLAYVLTVGQQMQNAGRQLAAAAWECMNHALASSAQMSPRCGAAQSLLHPLLPLQPRSRSQHPRGLRQQQQQHNSSIVPALVHAAATATNINVPHFLPLDTAPLAEPHHHAAAHCSSASPSHPSLSSLASTQAPLVRKRRIAPMHVL